METQNRGIELALFLTLPATARLHLRLRADRPRPVPARRVRRAADGAIPQLGARRLLDRPALLCAGQGADPRLLCARRHEDAGALRDRSRSAVNLVGNLILIPPLGNRHGHVGPPLATAICVARVNVFMLYRTLRRRGHFETDRQLRRRALPRLALAALVDGRRCCGSSTALADPYPHGRLLIRTAPR